MVFLSSAQLPTFRNLSYMHLHLRESMAVIVSIVDNYIKWPPLRRSQLPPQTNQHPWRQARHHWVKKAVQVFIHGWSLKVTRSDEFGSLKSLEWAVAMRSPTLPVLYSFRKSNLCGGASRVEWFCFAVEKSMRIERYLEADTWEWRPSWPISAWGTQWKGSRQIEIEA